MAFPFALRRRADTGNGSCGFLKSGGGEVPGLWFPQDVYLEAEDFSFQVLHYVRGEVPVSLNHWLRLSSECQVPSGHHGSGYYSWLEHGDFLLPPPPPDFQVKTRSLRFVDKKVTIFYEKWKTSTKVLVESKTQLSIANIFAQSYWVLI